jgi:DNA-binding CsgD family transcriptional regulator
VDFCGASWQIVCVLGALSARLDEAATVDAVLETTVALVPHAVASRGRALYLLDYDLRPVRVTARDLPERFLGEYERFGRDGDRLMAELLRRRTAVTERDAGPESTVCARWGMGRILIVPLFGTYGLRGSVNLVRPDGAPAFTAQEQLTALALAAQASVALARCEGAPLAAEAVALTPRERELLRLLGQGLRNREIARRRGVSEHAVHQALKRLYRKLGVRSRAAAVATGVRSGRGADDA